MRHVSAVLCLAAAITAQTDWQRIVTAASPQAQYHAAMAYDVGRSRTVLFGGRTAATVFGETWEYDGVNWTQAAPAHAPSPRVWPRVAFDLLRNVTVLFGGDVGSGETWQYDGLDWTLLTPATQPPPRFAQAMWYDLPRQRVMMFGGALRPSGTLVNDTWQWDGTDWTQLQPTTSPSPRYSIEAAYDVGRDRAVLFGGAGVGTIALNDTWEWNGADWHRVLTPTTPTPRWGNKLAYHLSRQRVVMVGGRDAGGSIADTSEYDGFDWHPIGTATAFTAVENHAVVFDLARDRVVSYGGYPPINETWEYGDQGSGRFVPYGVGCAGTMGTPSLEAQGVPRRGQPFAMVVRTLPQAAPFVIGLLGLSKTQWNGVPLPLALAPFGMPGCTLFTGQAEPFVVPQGATSAFWTFSIPNLPVLQGLHFYPQAAVPDPGANPAGVTFTDAAEATVG